MKKKQEKVKRQRPVFALISKTSFSSNSRELIKGVDKAASELDIDILRITTEYHKHQYAMENQIQVISEMIKTMDFDGILFEGWLENLDEQEKIFKYLPYETIPIVSLGKDFPDIMNVVHDGEKQLRSMIKHLADEHGYRNIVFVKPVNPDSRLDVYTEEMKKRGFFRPELILDVSKTKDKLYYVESESRGQNLYEKLFVEKAVKADCVLSMHTDEAVSFSILCRLAGINIPEDIALCSWEDGIAGRTNTPPITAVEYPFFKIGYEGCRKLYTRIRGGKAELRSAYSSDINLRESCGCLYKRPAKKPLKKTDTPELDFFDAGELMDEIKKNAKNNDYMGLIRFISKKTVSAQTSPEILLKIWNDFTVISRYILRNKIQTEKEYLEYYSFVPDIFYYIHQRIENYINQTHMREDRSKFFLYNMGLAVVTSFDLSMLETIFKTRFSDLGIKKCILLKYSDYSKGSLEYQYPESFTKDKVIQNRDLLNLVFKEDKRSTCMSYFLHKQQSFLGTVIFEGKIENDYQLYDLSMLLSSAIYGTGVLEELTQSNIKLGEAQKSILENVKIIEERSSQLEKVNKQLESLDNLKNDFIANITHDFRSLLSIIMNAADLGKMEIEMNREYIPDEDTDFFRIIYNSSVKLKMCIDQLLELARLDSGKIKLKIQPLNMKRFLSELVHFYESSIINSNIIIKPDFPKEDIERFYSDPEKLEQILNNVFSNALKFIDEDTGRIDIRLRNFSDHIQIEIADNGSGIEKEDLELIFSRFEQGKKSGSKKLKGSGIGLAFAKQLVELLKGKIWAESEGKNLGSSFFINLPKGKTHFTPEQIAPLDISNYQTIQNDRWLYKSLIEQEINEKRLESGMVTDLDIDKRTNSFNPLEAWFLIIEDNQDIQQIIKKYLNKAGYKNFIHAYNGEKGIEAAYKYYPNIILCDFNLPDMKGSEVQEKIYSNPDFGSCPLIFISAVNDKRIISKSKIDGASAFLKKPIDPDELILSVKIHLEKSLELLQTRNMASVDALTETHNMKNILSHLRMLVFRRSYYDLSIIMLDLDNFQEINSAYGHTFGNYVLSQTGHILNKKLRSSDITGRFGGDRFIIILPDTNIDQAAIVADKLHKEIGGTEFSSEDNKTEITVSMGIVSLKDNRKYMENLNPEIDIKKIYTAKHPLKNSDWEDIESQKQWLMDTLVDLAGKALESAKKSRCRKCGFASSIKKDFKNGQCPECRSKDLDIGKSKTYKIPSE